MTEKPYRVLGGPLAFKVRLLPGAEPLLSPPGLVPPAGIFDAPLFSVERIDGADIWVRPASYLRFFSERAGGPRTVRPLGVSGFIAEDGGMLIGRRPADVTQYAGGWEAVPSGSIDMAADDGTIDPVGALLVELEEECGLGADRSAVGLPVLVYDTAEETYDLCFPISVPGGVAAAVESARLIGHYSEVVCAPLAAIAGYRDPVVPATLALVDHLLASD